MTSEILSDDAFILIDLFFLRSFVLQTIPRVSVLSLLYWIYLGLTPSLRSNHFVPFLNLIHWYFLDVELVSSSSVIDYPSPRLSSISVLNRVDN